MGNISLRRRGLIFAYGAIKRKEKKRIHEARGGERICTRKNAIAHALGKFILVHPYGNLSILGSRRIPLLSLLDRPIPKTRAAFEIKKENCLLARERVRVEVNADLIPGAEVYRTNYRVVVVATNERWMLRNRPASLPVNLIFRGETEKSDGGGCRWDVRARSSGI